MKNDDAPLTGTTRITDEELDAFRAMKEGGERPARTSLLVFHRDGVRVQPLFEGQVYVVGRAAAADVAIRDNSLSRKHACIELLEGEVWVEDLGSTNGTWIDGERVDRAVVPAGADLAFGAVAATVHAATAAEVRRLGLEAHDRFVAELDVEVARTRAFGRSVALLFLRAEGRPGARVSRWYPSASRLLRPFDRAALYSKDTVELLLPELALAKARDLAEAILLSSPEPLRCSLGALPDHAGSAEELLEVVRRALAKASRDVPVATPRPLGESRPSRDDRGEKPPIAVSEAMQKALETARRLASSSIPVLIRGETGSGKEVIAQAIHEGGKRRGRPLVCVNCGAIPSQLVESTLFGHEQGAFTGATRERKGVFESANGGTVLLDEIGELPADVQAALLRVLESKRISRVGSSKEIDVDVRVLAATHRDLEAMSKTGQFRQDLLYRLNAMILEIPPLRARPEDIEPLVERFVEEARDAGECEVAGIAPEAMALLKEHHWPGNVRELRNAIERAALIANDPLITVEDLPEAVRVIESTVPTAKEAEAGDAAEEEANLRDRVQQVEADLIRDALEKAGWDRREAARRLGLPLRTMAHKMRQHGIRVQGRGRDEE